MKISCTCFVWILKNFKLLIHIKQFRIFACFKAWSQYIDGHKGIFYNTWARRRGFLTFWLAVSFKIHLRVTGVKHTCFNLIHFMSVFALPSLAPSSKVIVPTMKYAVEWENINSFKMVVCKIIRYKTWLMPIMDQLVDGFFQKRISNTWFFSVSFFSSFNHYKCKIFLHLPRIFFYRCHVYATKFCF